MKWNGIATVKKTFVGLNNFKVLFSQKVFWHSLWNSVVFMIVSLGVIFPISFLLALLVSHKTKINGFLRTAYYIPTLLPMTATGMMWMFMLAYNGGAINSFLAASSRTTGLAIRPARSGWWRWSTRGCISAAICSCL